MRVAASGRNQRVVRVWLVEGRDLLFLLADDAVLFRLHEVVAGHLVVLRHERHRSQERTLEKLVCLVVSGVVQHANLLLRFITLYYLEFGAVPRREVLVHANQWVLGVGVRLVFCVGTLQTELSPYNRKPTFLLLGVEGLNHVAVEDLQVSVVLVGDDQSLA